MFYPCITLNHETYIPKNFKFSMEQYFTCTTPHYSDSNETLEIVHAQVVCNHVSKKNWYTFVIFGFFHLNS